MDSIFCVHKKKKKSIMFIYIFVLTQNFGEMGGINYLIYVHRKEKGIYRVYLLIVADRESKKKSIGFIY